MFIKVCKLTVLPIFILLFAGCFGGPSVVSGVDLEELVDLDGEFELELYLDKAEAFGLDMRDPVVEGFVLTGASFDPGMLRMERYLTYEDDGQLRVRYIFTAIADGASEVVVKMEKAHGGPVEIYKRVTVKVGVESPGLF